MNNFALGKYMPLNSPIHRMDPRAKIMACLLYTSPRTFARRGARKSRSEEAQATV